MDIVVLTTNADALAVIAFVGGIAVLCWAVPSLIKDGIDFVIESKKKLDEEERRNKE
jgi:hypothetical protein